MSSQDDDKTIVGGALILAYSLTSNDGEKTSIEDTTTIGRSTDNDISIDNKKISRKHAIIEIINGRLQVTDLQSGNGTFVNGARIKQPTPLVHEDTVSFEQETYSVAVELPELEHDTDKTIVAEFTTEQQEIIDKAIDNQDSNSEDPTEIPKELDKVEAKRPTSDEGKSIPSSWIEDEKPVDGTKMMDPSQLAALKAGLTNELSQHDSKISRLHCFIDGSEQIVEMPIADSAQASGWEIGRDEQCDIVLDHSSVSNRHAQIIHQNGRWKIVNLVSTNGIMINGKKQLSGYLSDGDKIGLGSVNLIFKSPNSIKKGAQFGQSNKASKKNVFIPVIMGIILIVLAVLIYMKL